MMKTIGERIFFLREQSNITQKTLARDIGITEASLSRYENNLREPKGEVITKLATRLHTTTDFLLGCLPTPTDSTQDNELFVQVHTLSTESKKDLRRYIELLKLRDNAHKNTPHKYS